MEQILPEATEAVLLRFRIARRVAMAEVQGLPAETEGLAAEVPDSRLMGMLAGQTAQQERAVQVLAAPVKVPRRENLERLPVRSILVLAVVQVQRLEKLAVQAELGAVATGHTAADCRMITRRKTALRTLAEAAVAVAFIPLVVMAAPAS